VLKILDEMFVGLGLPIALKYEITAPAMKELSLMDTEIEFSNRMAIWT
jgi:hypothetical protein